MSCLRGAHPSWPSDRWVRRSDRRLSHHPGGIDRRQTGPFAPLVDNLQKEAILLLAESYIKDTRLAIEHYNVSVRELAEASARPR